MTALAKLLVLVNACLAVAVCTWALSGYLNRVDPADAIDIASGENIIRRVKRLETEMQSAQGLLPQELAKASQAELELSRIRALIRSRLAEAQTGTFVTDPIPTGRIDLIQNPPADKPILGLDNKPLRGRSEMVRDLDEQTRFAGAASKELEEQTKQQNELGPRILSQVERADRLKGIYGVLYEEVEYLADEQINWQSRSTSLIRRRNQLLDRLSELAPGTPGTRASLLQPKK